MRPRIGITSAPALDEGRRVDRVSRWYVDAVLRAGGLPVILPTLVPGDADESLMGLDGLLLTGGGDVAPGRYGEQPEPEVYGVDPARDAWELALVAAAGAAAPATTATTGGAGGAPGRGGPDLPVLGVCRGAQLLNVAAGGSLFQHLAEVTAEPHRQRELYQVEVHSVDIEPGSALAAIVGQRRLGVNSIHHQAIARVGERFRPVARADDGVIEAIERTDGAPVVAVQWHPESLIDIAPHGQLFLWLTRAAAGRRAGLEKPDAFEPAAPLATGLSDLVDDVA